MSTPSFTRPHELYTIRHPISMLTAGSACCQPVKKTSAPAVENAQRADQVRDDVDEDRTDGNTCATGLAGIVGHPGGEAVDRDAEDRNRDHAAARPRESDGVCDRPPRTR